MSDNVNNVESISPSINLDKAVDIINTVDNTNIEIDKHCDNIPGTDDIIKAAKDIKDHMDNIKQTNSKNVDNNSPNSDIRTDDIKTTDNDNDNTLNGKQIDNNNTDNNTDSNLTGKEKGYKNLIPLNNSTTDNVNNNDKPKTNGLDNLKPFNTMSVERQREIQKKGGKASQEKRKQRKTAKELLETLLSTNMSEDMIADVLGGSQDLLGDDKTAYNVMLTKMLQVACAGDTKAFVALRDTVGDKPADKQEITADIMTDADRKVIENIKKRIVNSAPID